MNIINADKGPILVGSGYVYACLASEFTDNMDVADMAELGYIQEGSPISLTRTHENKEINTENYGTVAITASNYKDEFTTTFVSYIVENIAKYLTGQKLVIDAETGDYTLYFEDEDKPPFIALAIVFEDENAGKKLTVYLPKCVCTSDDKIEFNNTDPVALETTFQCMSVTLPTGKRGTRYHKFETIEAANAEIAVSKSSVTVKQGESSNDIRISGATGAVSASIKDGSNNTYAKLHATISGDNDTVIISADADAVAANYTVTLTDTDSNSVAITVTVTAA